MTKNYEGRLEKFDNLTIIGWAVNNNDPKDIFNLSIYIDDVYLCDIKNDGLRQDLLKFGRDIVNSCVWKN